MAATSTTEQALLAAAREHFDAEEANDVERTVNTLKEDVIYEHPFQRHVMHGKDEVREYYRRVMKNGDAYGNLAIRRYWVAGDDAVALEVEGGPPNRRTITLAICKFRDGKLVHELVYGQGWKYPEA